MSGATNPSDETSRRRTNVIFLLRRMENPVTVDELADELERYAERRPDTPGNDASWEDIHERLHDEDLPALERAGLLTFDAERGIVTHTTTAESGPFVAEQAARRDDDHADEGASDGRRGVERYLLGLAIVSAAVLAATAFEVGPFAVLSSDAVTTALVVVLIVASGATALRQRG